MEEKILIKANFSKLNFLFVLLWIMFGGIILACVIMAADWGDIGPFFGMLVIALIWMLFILIIKHIVNKREFIVTNKRIIARGAFGYRKDIKLEKITSVSTYFCKGIGVGSSSAKIKFLFCTNKMEVFDTISKELLSE